MQEIGLASKVAMMYGSARIAWRHLYFAYHLFETEFPRSFLMEYSFEPNRVTCLYNWHSDYPGQSFLKLLTTTQTRATTDPRDRVFALLSHPSARTKNLHGRATRSLIGADYNKSFIEVYKLLATTLIETSQCLNVLSYVRGREQEAGLPTWAPMWNHQMRVAHCLLDSYAAFMADGNSSSATPWVLARTDSYDSDQVGPILGHHIRDWQLSVVSLSIGRVSWCFKNLVMEQYHELFQRIGNKGFSREPMAFELSSFRGLKSVLEQIRNELSLQDTTEIAETFAEVLTCGFLHPQYEGVGEPNAHVHYNRTYHDVHHSMTYQGDVIENHPDADLLLSLEVPDQSFQNAIDYVCEGRILFCTQTGFMGLGPASMRIGDEACILKGGKVPYILREATEGHYNLVGECYISGAMHGELVSSSRLDCSQISTRTVV
jgi:hypothetical protein